jgi:hypothetical protein
MRGLTTVPGAPPDNPVSPNVRPMMPSQTGRARGQSAARPRYGRCLRVRQPLYWWSVSPGVFEKTLSAVRSGAPM